MAVADPLIELRDVNKHRGTVYVPQRITLTVGRGEVTISAVCHVPERRRGVAR